MYLNDLIQCLPKGKLSELQRWHLGALVLHCVLHSPCSSSSTRRSFSRACKFLPRGRKRLPQNSNWKNITPCLAGCLSLLWAAGTAASELPWGCAWPGSKRPSHAGKPLGQSVTLLTATVPLSPRPIPDLCLKVI